MKTSNTKKVIILGAGLAGLACARTLAKNGIPSKIFEATDSVGGRVKTDVSSDGFRLDRGFQVLLNSYPELKNFVDFPSLELMKFNSGALILNGSDFLKLSNPLRRPTDFFSNLNLKLFTAKDLICFVKLFVKVIGVDKNSISSSGQTTAQFLHELGFSELSIRQFWRPFLAGVFLDSDLTADSDYFLFLMKCFSLGSATVPRLGMQELAKNIARPLDPSQIFFNKKAIRVTEKSDSVQVDFEDGSSAQADFVVQTFQLPHSETMPPPQWREVTTYSYCSEIAPPIGSWLLLVPKQQNMKINHLALMSSVSPTYAPAGQNLVVVTVLGDSSSLPDSTIQTELSSLFQDQITFKLIKKIVVKKALPVIPFTSKKTQIQNFKKIGRTYFCGDLIANPSINGALNSGRTAGLDILGG